MPGPLQASNYPANNSKNTQTSSPQIGESDKKEISFELSQDAADFFINSGILNGNSSIGAKSGEKTFDYIKEKYIGHGDLVISRYSGEATDNDNDFVLIFEDESGVGKGFGGYSKIATGLRVIVKDGQLQIFGLKEPEVDDSWWYNYKTEKEEVYRKLTSDDDTSTSSRIPIDLNSNQFQKFLQLIFNKFHGSYAAGIAGGDHFRGLRLGTEVELRYQKMFQNLFAQMKNKYDQSGNLEDKQKLFGEYAKMFALFQKALGNQKANQVIYGNDNGFNLELEGFIKSIENDIVGQVTNESDLVIGLNKLNVFLRLIRADLGLNGNQNPNDKSQQPSSSQEVNIDNDYRDLTEKNHATILLETISVKLGIDGKKLIEDKEIYAKALSSLVTGADSKELIQTVELKMAKDLQIQGLSDVDTTKAASVIKLAQLLGLRIADPSKVVVKQTANPVNYVFISDADTNNSYAIQILQIDDNGRTKLTEPIQKTFDQLKNLSANNVVQLISSSKSQILNNNQKKAIVTTSEELGLNVRSIGGSFIHGLDLINNQTDRELFVELVTNVDNLENFNIDQIFHITSDDTKILEAQNKVIAAVSEYLKANQADRSTKYTELSNLVTSLKQGFPDLATSIQQFLNTFDKANQNPTALTTQNGIDLISKLYGDRNKLAQRKIFDLMFALSLLKKHPDTYAQAKVKAQESILTLLTKQLGITDTDDNVITTLINFVNSTELDNLKGAELSDKIDSKINQVLTDSKLLATIDINTIKTPQVKPEISSLISGFSKILSSHNPLLKGDQGYLRDLILTLSSGTQLHPIQIKLLKDIFHKYGVLDTKLIELKDDEFMKLVNDDFLKFFNESSKERMIENCGLDYSESLIESTIGEIIDESSNALTRDELNKLKINAIDLRAFIYQDAKEGLKIYTKDSKGMDVVDDQILKKLEDIIRAKAKSKNLNIDDRLNEIIFRFLSRNSSSSSDEMNTRFSNMPYSASFPAIDAKFSIKEFSDNLQKDKDFAAKFLDRTTQLNSSTDRMDALRRYTLGKILMSPAHYNHYLSGITAGSNIYVTELRDAAKKIRETASKSLFPGFQRISQAGKTVKSIQAEVTMDDLLTYLGDIKFDMQIIANERTISISNHEKLLQLCSKLGIKAPNGKLIKANEDLIQLLNSKGQGPSGNFNFIGQTRSGQLSLNNHLLMFLLKNINDTVREVRSAESNSSKFSDEYKKEIFEESKFLNEIFGKYELVTEEEIMSSIAYMLQEAYYAANPEAQKPARKTAGPKSGETAPIPPASNAPEAKDAPKAGPAQPANPQAPVAMTQRVSLNLDFMSDLNDASMGEIAKKRKQALSSLASNIAAV